MATLLSLKRRIKAASNISKTTRAFQMIATSRLKKAQEAALSSRPYVQKLTLLTQELSQKQDEKVTHPYITPVSSNKKTLIIALSPDKGLCGGLVTNLVREFYSYSNQDKNATYIVVGKKIEGQVTKMQNEVLASFAFGTTLPTFDMVSPITKLIDEYYLSGKVDSVKVLYTDFGSFFSQNPKIQQLLPISIPENIELTTNSSFQLFEPDISSMLPYLLKRYMEMNLFQFLLESYLSEQAARMIAMQNATSNAKDIIEALQLEYNKTRQAKITSELLDITGGRVNKSA